jgi:hypothetical protein
VLSAYRSPEASEAGGGHAANTDDDFCRFLTIFYGTRDIPQINPTVSAAACPQTATELLQRSGTDPNPHTVPPNLRHPVQHA